MQSIVSSTILIFIFLRGGCDEISRGKTADCRLGEQTHEEAPLFETIKWLPKHVNEIEKDKESRTDTICQRKPFQLRQKRLMA